MKIESKRTQKKSQLKISKRLIAAAPQLLWACEDILSTLEDLELDDIGALADVRRAIFRATGKIVRKKRR